MTGCLSKDYVNYFEEDQATIDAYLTEQEMIGQTRNTPNGVRIVTLNEDPVIPIVPNYDGMVLDINYKLKVFSDNPDVRGGGATLAQDSSYHFNMYNGAFIYGVTEGVAEMYAGEKAELFIPSPLAYGGMSFTMNGINVPSNSIMRCEAYVNAARTPKQHTAYEQDLLKQYIADSLQTEEFETIQVEVEENVFIDGEMTKVPYTAEMYKVVLQSAPDSAQVEQGDYVEVAYEGSLMSGYVFDKSENYEFSFNYDNFVKGWSEGLQTMRKGEQSLLLMPSVLGYGSRGSGSIAPYSPLIFDLEVKDVN